LRNRYQHDRNPFGPRQRARSTRCDHLRRHGWRDHRGDLGRAGRGDGGGARTIRARRWHGHRRARVDRLRHRGDRRGPGGRVLPAHQGALRRPRGVDVSDAAAVSPDRAGRGVVHPRRQVVVPRAVRRRRRAAADDAGSGGDGAVRPPPRSREQGQGAHQGDPVRRRGRVSRTGVHRCDVRGRPARDGGCVLPGRARVGA